MKIRIGSPFRNGARAAQPLEAALQPARETAARILRPAARHLALFTLALVAAASGFASKKLAPDIANKNQETVDVIVQFKSAPDYERLKQISARGELKHVFTFIHAAHMSLPLRDVQALESDPSVVYVSPDRKVSGADTSQSSVVGQFEISPS